MSNISDSSERFVANLRERLSGCDNTVDADPNWLPGSDGILVEETTIDKLSEEEFELIERLRRAHEMAQDTNPLKDSMIDINAFDSVRVKVR